MGDQTGGRVFLFLHTDDFDATIAHDRAGVGSRTPDEPYGTVAVFEDLYGAWDLLQPK